MHCVNEIEVSPHETVRAVHGVQAPAKNTWPGIESSACTEATSLQLLRRHAAWLKRYLIVSVSIVEPPRVEPQSAFGIEATVKRSAREGSEVIECRDVHCV